VHKINTWSRLNSKNYSGFNSQGTNHRGRRRGVYRDLLEYAFDQVAITSMSATPSVDFLKACAANEDLRLDLRITAATAAAKYESHSKAPRPYSPSIPAGFKLPRLVSVAACQESLAIITESVLAGTLTPDAGDYLRRHVEAVLPSLQQSEVAAEIEALRTFIDSVEQARTIDHVPDKDQE
jgi:hypothetical protein